MLEMSTAANGADQYLHRAAADLTLNPGRRFFQARRQALTIVANRSTPPKRIFIWFMKDKLEYRRRSPGFGRVNASKQAGYSAFLTAAAKGATAAFWRSGRCVEQC